jgi:hypothetical protein
MCNNEELYIEWDKSRYLVLSSALFLIPSLYAYLNHIYFLSSVLFGVSVISMNYWRKASNSLRRKIDIFTANVSLIIFVYNGFYYFIPSIVSIRMCICGLFVMYYFYLSNVLYKNKNKNWYKYHILFHIGILHNQIFVIYNIVQYNNKLSNK